MSRHNPLVRLRTGVRSSPREDGLLQVGSDPRRRVLLPDTVSVRQLLHVLPEGLRVNELGDLARMADALKSAGLLVDEDERTLLAQARATTLVEVLAPDAWRSTAVALVQRAGLALHGEDPRQRDDPGVTLLVHDGEPSRDDVDELLRSDRPLLLVGVVDARVRVGPFIVLGSSTCLRCLDAYAAERDPWFRPPTPPLPLDQADDAPVTLTLTQALVSAVSDVCAWAEGRQPGTWCATRYYDDALVVEESQWDRHPHCGCTWADGLVAPA